ncbi:MAG: P-II family nitrogen regulator [Bacteroidota bacterium]
MKQIIGVVRRESVGEVLRELSHNGFGCLSVFDMKGLWNVHDPEHEHLSFEYETYYSTMSRVEVLCKDDDAQKAFEIIKREGRTQHQGDGYVFISTVERLANIADGQEGECVLQS